MNKIIILICLTFAFSLIILFMGNTNGYILDESISNISTTRYFGYIDNGSQMLFNNVWGTTTDERQNKTVKATIYWNYDSHYGWTWNRPNPNPTGYTPPLFQEIIVGERYWDNPLNSPTQYLPVQISDINSLKLDITYNYTKVPTGWFDMAFDIWITKVYPPVNDASQRMDCFIVLQGMKDGGKKDPLVSPIIENVFDGINNYNHHYNSKTGNHGFTLTPLENPPFSQQYTVNLKALFDILENEGYLNSSWYLPGIEFGNEVFYGNGMIEISQLNVTLNDKIIK